LKLELDNIKWKWYHRKQSWGMVHHWKQREIWAVLTKGEVRTVKFSHFQFFSLLTFSVNFLICFCSFV